MEDGWESAAASSPSDGKMDEKITSDLGDLKP